MASNVRAFSTKPSNDTAMFYCCDIQDTFKPLMPMEISLIPASRFLLKASKVLNIPVLVTEQKPFKPTITELQEVYQESLDAKDGRVALFEKKVFSMVTEETKPWIDSHPDRKNAYIFGVEGHVCVMQTALDLLRDGHTVYLVEDAILSQRPNDRQQALCRLRDAGCIITTAESCLYEIMGSAAHPCFRSMLPIVKEFGQSITVQAKQ
jgi:hypothetical protein